MTMAFVRRELLFHLDSPVTLRNRLRRNGLQGQSTCQVVPVFVPYAERSLRRSVTHRCFSFLAPDFFRGLWLLSNDG